MSKLWSRKCRECRTSGARGLLLNFQFGNRGTESQMESVTNQALRHVFLTEHAWELLCSKMWSRRGECEKGRSRMCEETAHSAISTVHASSRPGLSSDVPSDFPRSDAVSGKSNVPLSSELRSPVYFLRHHAPNPLPLDGACLLRSRSISSSVRGGAPPPRSPHALRAPTISNGN